jgi:hypothetical protein
VLFKQTYYPKGKAMKIGQIGNIKKVGVIALTASSLVAGTFVLAQEGTPTQEDVQEVQGNPFGFGRHGFGPGFGDVRGIRFPFRGLELGTTATITFYDGDPEAGGTTLNTLTFTYGEDSEVAFAEEFETARADAAYMTVDLSEQTRTVDLSDFADDERGDLRPRELGRLGGLTDGSTITAAFYDTDPETAGATATETLTFTYGTSSEAGFANDFGNAAETASFVVITTSPQSYTVNLAEVQDFQGRRGPGGFGPGFGQDGPRGPQ